MTTSHPLNWYMDSKQAQVPIWRVFVAAAERARQQSTWPEVEPLYQKAIEQARKTLSNPHKDVSTILLRLADFQYEQKHFVAAEATYRSAVEELEKAGLESSILLAAALSKLAEVYEGGGDSSRAEEAWERIKGLLAQQLKALLDEEA